MLLIPIEDAGKTDIGPANVARFIARDLLEDAYEAGIDHRDQMATAIEGERFDTVMNDRDTVDISRRGPRFEKDATRAPVEANTGDPAGDLADLVAQEP